MNQKTLLEGLATHPTIFIQSESQRAAAALVKKGLATYQPLTSTRGWITATPKGK